MFLALDIETMADASRTANLPEPEVKLGNLVDPAKIKAKKDEAKADQLSKCGLSPMTGRVICCGAFSTDTAGAIILPEATDAAERELIQSVFKIMANPEVRLVTFNGNSFDLPFIYRRAMILGVAPKHFGAPPLTAWTKRYDNDKHIDMMTVWAGTNKLADADNLADVAAALLGETRAAEEYEKFPELMQTQEGRDHIAAACLHHTELTYRIFERAQGCLFA
jgi:predicted PolB exonuclease-like 3'-5' exonuclease